MTPSRVSFVFNTRLIFSSDKFNYLSKSFLGYPLLALQKQGGFSGHSFKF